MSKSNDPGFVAWQMLGGRIDPQQIADAKENIQRERLTRTDIAVTQIVISKYVGTMILAATRQAVEVIQNTESSPEDVVLAVHTAYYQGFALTITALLPELGWTHPELTLAGSDDA